MAGTLLGVLSGSNRAPWAHEPADLPGEPPGGAAYLGPCALAVVPEARTLLVACAGSHQVLWVALPDGKVMRRVSVPAEPTGIAVTPDGRRAIVTCAAPRSPVVVFDASSGRALARLVAGHTAISPVVSPDGQRLYVCNRFDADVSVMDLGSGRELARVPVVREPVAAAITPDGRTLLVANHLPDAPVDRPTEIDVSPMVTAIDTRALQPTQIALPHGAHSLRGLCVSPDGRYALVTHLLGNFERIPFQVRMGWINVNVVSVIDARSRQLIGTPGLDEYYQGAGNPWGVCFTPDGKRVCVAISGTHELGVIDTALLSSDRPRRIMEPMMGVWPIYVSLGESPWRRIALPGKGPRALVVVGTTAYVAEYFSDALAVVDLEAPGTEAVRHIALGPPPKLDRRRLGELLFHDATICDQQWQSCASCHPDGRSDALNWDLTNDGPGTPKNTKSLLLAHQTPPAMAEAVRPTAEAAVRAGLEHILFAARPEAEAAAIDAYLRALAPVPSPHRIDGRLSEAAQRGRILFESQRVGCSRCHPAPLYTDLRSHDVGTRRAYEHTRRFDTPTLIEVWRTAPYLHDGRYRTIEQLLVEGRHGRAERLDRQELEDLIEFVRSL